MKNNIVVKGYSPILNVKETQFAIKLVKDTFQRLLSKNLGLVRVSAPLFVKPETGLNDNLNGFEKAVNFVSIETNANLEIVQSLAKWKRYALDKYDVDGLYTDMNAIRPFEELDNLHSLYVDQWDWEKRINRENRNEEYLKDTVRKIYSAFRDTATIISKEFKGLKHDLPEEIVFIDSNDLYKMYPNMSSKERENAYVKEHKAVFLMRIGGKLDNGLPHDGRAADYDDWTLNGDILIWYEPLNIAFEISSMGIRVDRDSLLKQLKERNEEYKISYPYHKAIINDEYPLSIGGGIGQSRICMFMLNKVHIGEVQCSYWSKEDIELFEENNIHLL